jgi:hypothetical protein
MKNGLVAEFLKFVGPKGQNFGSSDRSLIFGGPIVRQTFFVVLYIMALPNMSRGY